MADCAHLDFEGQFDVHRLTEDDQADSPVKGYMADIRIKCVQVYESSTTWCEALA